MTDDELSEFAEMLAEACNADGHVSAYRNHCPLAAAIGRPGLCTGSEAIVKLGIPERTALSFIAGFDGLSLFGCDDLEREAIALGQLFREMYP